MSAIVSFRSIIDLWTTREAMASDLGAGAAAVSKWWQRDNIPAEWWSAVLASGPATAAGVTAERLAELAARESAPLVPAEARV